jgi:hypothetical protein
LRNPSAKTGEEPAGSVRGAPTTPPPVFRRGIIQHLENVLLRSLSSYRQFLVDF